MPNWIWKLPNLSYLDLSYNFLVTLEGPILNVSLFSLHLRSNQLQGQLPNIPHVEYLDFSENSLDPSILANISWSLPSVRSIFLSSNKLNGSIPGSICNATYFEGLDLSNNFFSGTIPQCLIEMSGSLNVINLRKNNLIGIIPDAFPDNCGLQTLSLNKNQLEGGLPKSLANCIGLEVLDIGNNHIEGTFPIYLKNTSWLSVLVLRSNKFYGSITHLELNVTWPWLQIVDIASNNFTGNLPIILLLSWTSMMDRGHGVGVGSNYLAYIGNFSYQDTVTIISKGLEMELVKIPTILTTLDFSCNYFDGPIPEEIGELTLLHTLNLSHNAFTSEIPPSLGKLSHLESLDLSNNELSGEIPVQLANGLIFLSVLNLSFNQLVGQIPLMKQFNTFSATSFEGNERLCGLPLKTQCTYEDPRLPPPTYEENHKSMIEWNYISAELGFVFGFGIVIAPLMFWRRWRIWYYKHVDDIMFRIFPQLCLRKEHHQRQAFRNQEPRH
ncbi:receptor-like protein 33 [Corylus avellana]|uniref:receptor-like protein 33 n=1 Tax=Corylus avellana TaxID=13451 RepID=UPI00286D05AB|nr:receptor-like protein 33 [Corylus avellana]XP_059431087.1 receptor-like protein 33 [Corylus avellana]